MDLFTAFISVCRVVAWKHLGFDIVSCTPVTVAMYNSFQTSLALKQCIQCYICKVCKMLWDLYVWKAQWNIKSYLKFMAWGLETFPVVLEKIIFLGRDKSLTIKLKTEMQNWFQQRTQKIEIAAIERSKQLFVVNIKCPCNNVFYMEKAVKYCCLPF